MSVDTACVHVGLSGEPCDLFKLSISASMFVYMCLVGDFADVLVCFGTMGVDFIGYDDDGIEGLGDMGVG